MLIMTLWILGGVIALYTATATVFLLTAKIEKGENGERYLNPDSWHCAVAYPLNYQKVWFRDKLAEDGINICLYFAKFFCMLYVGWPLAFIAFLVTRIIGGPIMLLFGFYPSARIISIVEGFHDEDTVEVFDPQEMDLPYVYGFEVLPIYIIAPAAYLWLLFAYPGVTIHYTEYVLGVCAAIAAFVGLVKLYKKAQTSETQSVSLMREFIAAKKARYCFTLKSKPPVHA